MAPKIRLAGPGIVLGDAVGQGSALLGQADGGAGVNVNAQDFCQQRRAVLAAAKGIVPQAPIAQRNVKESPRTETDLAPFVVAEGLRHFQQDALGTQVGEVGVGGRHLEFADDAAARELTARIGVLLVVVNVKQSVGLEARMKGEAQQSLLIIHIRFASHDIHKLLPIAAVAPLWRDENPARLLDEKETARIVRRLAHPNRAIQRQGRKGRAEPHLGKGLGGGQTDGQQEGTPCWEDK